MIVCPIYDGNGNVSEYLDGAGVVLAHFECNAFGNTVVANGMPTGLDIGERSHASLRTCLDKNIRVWQVQLRE
jgi:hypothetical protein